MRVSKNKNSIYDFRLIIQLAQINRLSTILFDAMKTHCYLLKRHSISCLMFLLSLYFNSLCKLYFANNIQKFLMKLNTCNCIYYILYLEKQVTIVLSPDEYVDKLVEYCMLKLYAVASVVETSQVWGDEMDFQAGKPTIDIKVKYYRIIQFWVYCDFICDKTSVSGHIIKNLNVITSKQRCNFPVYTL